MSWIDHLFKTNLSGYEELATKCNKALDLLNEIETSLVCDAYTEDEKLKFKQSLGYKKLKAIMRRLSRVKNS